MFRSPPRLRRLSLLLSSLAVACASDGSTSAPPDRRPTTATPPAAIAPWVDFLSEQREAPVDYLLSLFDEHDLVIVCERAHPEATQYELFWRLVSDPRFRDRVGHVFTELGLRNLQPELDRVMATPDLSEEEMREHLLPIYRDLSFHPLWPYSNFFDFLVGLHGLNQRLPEDERVRLYFSDVEYSWAGMTAEKRADFEAGLGERDRAMADLIVQRFRALEREDPDAKALVIMNYRHAYNDFRFDDGSRGDNVGRYLFEAFPGRVANVLLNTLALRVGSTDSEPVLAPIQEGRWDAAFRFLGDPAVGFDLEGSPFGADSFDHFPVRTETVRYADVFDGFVFWQPVRDQRYDLGVPGLVDETFLHEVRRRFALLGTTPSPEDEAEWLALSHRPRSEPVGGAPAVESAIDRWLGTEL